MTNLGPSLCERLESIRLRAVGENLFANPAAQPQCAAMTTVQAPKGIEIMGNRPQQRPSAAIQIPTGQR